MATFSNSRTFGGAYLAAFFAVGFAAIVAQVVLMREFFVVLGGNELIIGVILASWLAAIGLGAWLAALLADRLKPALAFFLSLITVLALVLPCQIAAIRGARGLLGVAPGEAIPLAAAMLFCLLVTAPSSLLVGLLFPFAGRLAAEARGEAVGGVAELYIAESAGSLAGGVLFTFFLVETLAPMQAAFLNAALLGVGGFAAALTILKPLRRGAVTSLFVLLVAVAGLGLPGIAADIDRDLGLLRWRQNTGDIELVAAADSRYQHIEVGRTAEQYNLYLNGSTAGYVPADYSHAQLAHFLMSQHPNPREILVIGDGTDGLLPTLAKYDVERIDYVLQDDAALRLINRFNSQAQLAAAGDRRIRTSYGDGRQFLQQTGNHYDLILAILPPPSNALLNRYYTEEFFGEVRARLRPGGVFVLPLPMTPGYVGGVVGSFVGSITESLERHFSQILVCPEPDVYAFCSADEGSVTGDIELLSQRWHSRALEGEPFHEALFSAWLDPQLVAERKAEIEALPPAGRNTDLQPTAYLYRLLIWNRTTAEAGERGTADAVNGAILTLRDLTPWTPALALCLLLAAALGARRLIRKPAPRFAAIVVIATTGFVAMAVEIMLIFVYQNIFGYIYREIGLIIALFMAGLAVGAWWGHSRSTIHERITRRTLLLLEGVMIALALLIPAAASFGASLLPLIPAGRFILIGIMFFAGFATGAQFPLAVDLYLRGKDEKVGAGAGAVDSADHIGAALGAALTGVLLVPVFGIWATALLLALLKVVSGAVLLRY